MYNCINKIKTWINKSVLIYAERTIKRQRFDVDSDGEMNRTQRKSMAIQFLNMCAPSNVC